MRMSRFNWKAPVIFGHADNLMSMTLQQAGACTAVNHQGGERIRKWPEVPYCCTEASAPLCLSTDTANSPPGHPPNTAHASSIKLS